MTYVDNGQPDATTVGIGYTTSRGLRRYACPGMWVVYRAGCGKSPWRWVSRQAQVATGAIR